MTDQIPDKLTNNHAAVDLTDLRLYAIITGEPRSKQSRPYEFKTLATPAKGKNSSALWRGYFSTYVLWQTGKITLEQFTYPFHEGRPPDVVYEELQGDFWLVMRSSFLGKTTYVPFRNGTVVEDRRYWISVDAIENPDAPQEKFDKLPFAFPTATDLTQRLVLICGLFLLMASFAFVPYEATYIRRGENSRANVGYHFVFSPPKPTEVCPKAFGLRTGGMYKQVFSQEVNRNCYLKPVIPQALFTAASIIAASFALFLLLGLFKRSPNRSET